MSLLNEYEERAKNFEKMLINMVLKSENKISLIEAYSLPYNFRSEFIQTYNEYMEEKKKSL